MGVAVERVYVSLSTLLALQGEKLPSWMRRVAYILLDSRCWGRCTYCWVSRGIARLARVTWYPVATSHLLNKASMFQRICIQTVIKPGMLDELLDLVVALKTHNVDAVSVSIGAASPAALKALKEAGVDMIGVGLDAATERIARRTRRPYPVSLYMATLREAVRVFGPGNVYAHVIVGLGETASTLAKLLEKIYSFGARAALFAYTAANGRPLVPLCYYRGAQLYKQLLEEGLDPLDYIAPGPDASWFIVRPPPLDIVARAIATSGCPPCNRPYYTESPRGPLYNIPWTPSLSEARQALRELKTCEARGGG